MTQIKRNFVRITPQINLLLNANEFKVIAKLSPILSYLSLGDGNLSDEIYILCFISNELDIF